MKDKIVIKVVKSGCTNIISFLKITYLSPKHINVQLVTHVNDSFSTLTSFQILYDNNAGNRRFEAFGWDAAEKILQAVTIIKHNLLSNCSRFSNYTLNNWLSNA